MSGNNMEDLEKILNEHSTKVDIKSIESRILMEFSNWVAELELEGRLLNLERSTLDSWLEKNYPDHLGLSKKIWIAYTVA